jgi:hypothetical protein
MAASVHTFFANHFVDALGSGLSSVTLVEW